MSRIEKEIKAEQEMQTALLQKLNKAKTDKKELSDNIDKCKYAR